MILCLFNVKGLKVIILLHVLVHTMLYRPPLSVFPVMYQNLSFPTPPQGYLQAILIKAVFPLKIEFNVSNRAKRESEQSEHTSEVSTNSCPPLNGVQGRSPEKFLDFRSLRCLNIAFRVRFYGISSVTQSKSY